MHAGSLVHNMIIEHSIAKTNTMLNPSGVSRCIPSGTSAGKARRTRRCPSRTQLPSRRVLCLHRIRFPSLFRLYWSAHGTYTRAIGDDDSHGCVLPSLRRARIAEAGGGKARRTASCVLEVSLLCLSYSAPKSVPLTRAKTQNRVHPSLRRARIAQVGRARGPRTRNIRRGMGRARGV